MAVVMSTTLTPAEAGRLHADVSMQTYTDFGQNMGRYVVGDRVNALLESIRRRDGGVRIYYTDGTAPYTITNAQGMVNFGGTGDNGSYAAIAPNAIATVLYNDSNNASFTERYVGPEHAINYSAIDVRNSARFRLAAPNGYGYMLQRQSKIVTDVVWNPLTTVTDVSALGGQKLYHAGAGTVQLQSVDGEVTILTGGYEYIVGGISSVYQSETGYSGDGSGNFGVAGYIDELYYNTGVSGRTPMPNLGVGGDSGSPYYHYNTDKQRYEYIGALYAGDEISRNYVRNNAEWTRSALNECNATVDMKGASTVYLHAVDTMGATYSESVGEVEYGTTLYSGEVKDAKGKTLATYNGIQSKKHTWKDLSDIKNSQNWYAYDSDAYLAQSDADLFFTQNLVFNAKSAKNKIILNDTIDLGVGYVEFNGGSFTIMSDGKNNYQLDSAGYVISDGATVHLQLVNTADRMTEWRKIGGGTLYIDGSGDTNALLNVGGSGVTCLQQSNGCAAYNVLANTGAKVVIGDVGQIERDFTFGVGGGTLDMNGNSMDWYTSSGSQPRSWCFTINALTEEARIYNGAGVATLTYMESGDTTYLGSFCDSKKGALVIDYRGGGTWTLHSIHTNLTNNAASRLSVSDGTVLLAGAHTRHGMGSADGGSRARAERDNDWHYADAAMDVTVKEGATFELGSHARLKGDVTVEAGGTYIMREGVQSRYEYVEGGANLDDTYEISGFYGHTGNVALAGDMEVQFSEGTTANNTYSGRLSGNGTLSVDTGAAGGMFTLSGENSHTGGTVLNGGVLRAGNMMAFGSGVVTLRGGVLDLNLLSVENDIFATGGTLGGGFAIRW